ncbi:MAG TPA: nucleotidyltransferase [Candidatus Paceibacterota bacterium]
MKNEVQAIGSFLQTDTDGFIVNTTSPEKIQAAWMPAVEMVKDAYQKHLGEHLHSVYIRGSVAKGQAINNISDIDSFAVVTVSYDDVDIQWSKDFVEKVKKQFPFIVGVEIGVVPLEEIPDSKGDRIMIKTQSICVYGNNLFSTLPALKPGVDTAQHFEGIEREINKTKEWLQEERSEEEIKRRCTWIMKRIIRSGFELVMERSQKYTRDLYPCYEEFSKYYPEKKEEMYKALELAVNPTSDKNTIVDTLENLGSWLVKEIDTVFK